MSLSECRAEQLAPDLRSLPVHSASRGPDDDGRLEPYLRAEYQGRAQGDCQATYAGCPVSLFNLI